MKEKFHFHFFTDYFYLLPKNDAKLNGLIYELDVLKTDPLFKKIGEVQSLTRSKYNDFFILYWEVKRAYSKKELDAAKLFRIKIKHAFEPTAEECGTEYNEETACKICGANRVQLGPLKLRKSSIPKKDIARTIAGEVVVSKKLKNIVENNNLSGFKFGPVYTRNTQIDYYQLKTISENLNISNKTIVGINPFELISKNFEETEIDLFGRKLIHPKSIGVCPNGHIYGAKLISELYVKESEVIEKHDIFITDKTIGVRQSLLRPEPVLICSKKFRDIVIYEKLKGFDFEVVNIV